MGHNCEFTITVISDKVSIYDNDALRQHVLRELAILFWRQNLCNVQLSWNNSSLAIYVSFNEHDDEVYAAMGAERLASSIRARFGFRFGFTVDVDLDAHLRELLEEEKQAGI